MLNVCVQKEFASFAVDLDFEVEPAFTALFGPSGVGKTTTLNLISGLVRPSRGKIVLDGRVLFCAADRVDLPARKRNIGYIFQESRLFPHLSVRRNLEFGYERVPVQNRKFTPDEIVAVTGLARLLDRMPSDLSGGEKQRVALGRALLASPEYLLMDEPLAALDLPVKLSFLNFLRDVHQRFDLPILYVSHDLSSVLKFAQQVIILQNGRNVGYGPPYALLDKMTAQPLVSGEDIPNIFEVQIQSHQASSGTTIAATQNLSFTLPQLDVDVGEKLLLNIPASEIILSTEEPRNVSASNVLPSRLTKLHHLGERVLAEIDAGENFTVEIVPATVKRLDLSVNKRLFLIIKASSFRRLG